MDASRIRMRLVLALDGLLIAACLFGLDGLNRKAGLPVDLEPTQWFVATSSSNAGPVVRRMTREGADLRPGDVIRSLAGQPVSKSDEIEFVCDARRLGDRVQVEVERDGRGVHLDTTLVPVYTGFEVAVNGLVAALFFGLAILVTLRRPDDDAALLCHASSASFAVLIAATWGALGGGLPGVALTVRLVFSAAYALAPALFVHFTLVFPRHARVGARRAVVVLYAVALGFAVVQAHTFSRAFASGSVADFRAFLSWFDACRLFAAAGLFTGLVLLVCSYRTASEESERRQIRLVVPGFTVPVLAFVGLWIVPQRLTGQALVPEAPLNIAALVAPLTFAAAIIRYHALGIDQIINRGTVYAVVAAVLAAIYTAVTAAIVWLLGLQSPQSVIGASGVAAVCGVLLFDPVRRRVQTAVDRTFFRVRYDATAALRTLGGRMSEAIDEKDLAEHVVGELDSLLGSERVSVAAFRPADGDLVILAERGATPPDLPVDRARLPRAAAAAPLAVEAGAPMAEADAALLQALGAVAIFPFAASDGLPVGFIATGRKRSGLRLSLEDLVLLQGVAQEAGRAIERLRLREELLVGRAEARRVEELARVRSDFVSNVSHELRTPLTSIRMFAELLRTGAVPPSGPPSTCRWSKAKRTVSAV